MDLASVIGLVLVLVLIIGSILLDGIQALFSFFDVPSLLIVVLGSLAATMTAFRLEDILGAVGVARKAFFASNEPASAYVGIIVKFAEKARKEGMLALESLIEEEKDEFLKKGLRLAVDGTDPEAISSILEIEVQAMEDRHKMGQAIFSKLGELAPAFGMIGTLVGLINMLRSLDDPASIGGSMAVALITTFYGAVLANGVYIPIASKLELRSKEEMLIRSMVIEGIMSIQSGDNPRVVEEKLKSYLLPAQRETSSGE